MSITYSTLPAGDTALQDLLDRLPGAAASPRPPALPQSPLPGSADAGWLARDAGLPCAYGWIRRQTGGRALLEVDALPPNLAAAFPPLLGAALEQAAEWECTRVVAYAPDANTALAGLYENAGFSRAGAVTELRIDIPQPPPGPTAPEGYFLRSYRELDHLPTLAAVLHRAYHDRFSRPEYETDGVTAEIVQAEFDRHPGAGIEQDYFILLNFFGKAVGVVRCRGPEWIDAPGVVPEERDNGLHTSLLAAALRRLQARGGRSAWVVAFDEEPGPIDAYRRMGCTVYSTRTCWQKELS